VPQVCAIAVVNGRPSTIAITSSIGNTHQARPQRTRNENITPPWYTGGGHYIACQAASPSTASILFATPLLFVSTISCHGHFNIIYQLISVQKTADSEHRGVV
jgi:hypothetical protein